jgi:hypothetical protein
MVTMRSCWLMGMISAGSLIQGRQVLGGGFTIGGVEVDLKGSLDISLPAGVEEEDPLINALGGLVGSYEQATHMVVPAHVDTVSLQPEVTL